MASTFITNNTTKLPYSSISLRQGAENILAAALEVWAHQLLYQRCVYPVEAFASTGSSFQGITSCQACRHPPVVSYISETVQVAVPSFLDGVATELALRIVQREPVSDSAVVADLEVYKWQMIRLDDKLLAPRAPRQVRATKKGKQQTFEMREKQRILQQLDTAVRNVILAVLRLPRGPVSKSKHVMDSISFELTLTIPKEDRTKCSLLTEGFANGRWSSRPEWNPIVTLEEEENDDRDDVNLVDLTGLEDDEERSKVHEKYTRPEVLSACLQSVNTRVCGINFLVIQGRE
mmetsp:Transcript_20887/g.45305  ORF Transcript_20887/g.45305 Transcript_20887/m.45305 type:complete len:291 (-) Transcript_20887:166-1038(-)|eukprot:CAMPEP_0168822056 /NCGR_PEP_ID=MMETSP0726-20121227/9752_1 /TAXON_ID=265536 /ORGANISM="Amphiprora sp., Strain CCMP467" /LENGTH=290 /DNA_ID=CAMNT_0008874755 /DNA_START=176 /DNA_END=1048 /DNA_ORIENTATION=+